MTNYVTKTTAEFVIDEANQGWSNISVLKTHVQLPNLTV